MWRREGRGRRWSSESTVGLGGEAGTPTEDLVCRSRGEEKMESLAARVTASTQSFPNLFLLQICFRGVCVCVCDRVMETGNWGN